MQLKKITETFLPQLLHLGFGKELFTQLDQQRHLAVKSFAGSSPAVFAAELFLIKKKSILFLTDDKEDALYITSELEDLLGKQNVLYFPPTHLDPYQIEKNAKCQPGFAYRSFEPHPQRQKAARDGGALCLTGGKGDEKR